MWEVTNEPNHNGFIPEFHCKTEAETRAFWNLITRPNPIMKLREVSWKDRELARFNSNILYYKPGQHGQYDDLPQYEPLPWTEADLPPIPDHFAHPSTENPALIAYTQSPEKGERNIQTTTRPGRYLEKNYPNLTQREIEGFTIRWAAKYAPKIDLTKGEVLFTKDPDLMVALYATRSIHSCMVGNKGVRSYATGPDGLGMVYMVDKGGRYCARAVVWDVTKVYTSAYINGNGNSANFERQLHALGYVPIHTRYSGFNGARVEKSTRGSFYANNIPLIEADPNINDPEECKKYHLAWYNGTRADYAEHKFYHAPPKPEEVPATIIEAEPAAPAEAKPRRSRAKAKAPAE